MGASDVDEPQQSPQDWAPEIGTSSNEATSHEYHLPEWFLKENVKTPTELARLESRIYLSNHDSLKKSQVDDNQCPAHENSSAFEIPYDVFSELSDTTAAAFVRNADGQLPPELPGVLIRTLSTRLIKPVDEIVIRLAQEINAALVSIDLEDLQDIAGDFIRQDDGHNQATLDEDGNTDSTTGEKPDYQSMTSLAEYYFGIRSKKSSPKGAWIRTNRAILAITNSARKKSQARGSSMLTGDDVSHDTPIIIHFQNMDRIVETDSGYRCVARFRDCIQEHRRAGENLVLLATIMTVTCEIEDTYADFSSMVDEPKMIRKMGLCKGFAVAVMPTLREQEEPSVTEKKDYYNTMVNIRRLKRLLRRRLANGDSVEIIHPISSWGKLGDSLTDSLWEEQDLRRAATQIVGRTFKKPALSLDDVETVLRRLNLCEKPLQITTEPQADETEEDMKQGEDEGEGEVEEEEEEEEQEQETWRDKIDRIMQDCNEFENNLRSSIVSPETLEVTYDDIVIDTETKDTMKYLVSMSNFRPDAKSGFLLRQIQINGALLYGPPGTGKTHLSRAVAKDSGASMLAIDSASIISKWSGESEKHIRAAFTLAAKLFPCVLFIDEVDSLFYRRASDDKSWERNTLTQFLQCLDGLVKDERRPFVIAATNRPADLDEAFLRRLPQKIFFKLPDAAGRLKILRLFLKDEDLHPSLSVEGLAHVTEGYSGSDLRSLCGEAAMIWAIEKGREEFDKSARERSKLCLEVRHFSKALRKIPPSVSKRTLMEFTEFAQQYNMNESEDSGIASNIIDEHFITKFHVQSDETTVVSTDISRTTSTSEPSFQRPESLITEVRGFPYESLGDDEFRVLVIEPDKIDSTLKAELTHASFMTPPKYHALSYTWGPSDPAYYMNCGGTETTITKNLHDALCQLRQPDKSVTVWADAVCINQTDDEEKSRQVSRMREIYSKAEFLFIWIGNPQDPSDADLAFDTLKILEETFLRHADENDLRLPWPADNTSKYTQWGLEVGKEFEQNPIKLDQWKALGQVYLAPWFSRVWIYQEAVSFAGNPQSNITMSFGTRRISWDSFAKVTGGLSIFGGVLKELVTHGLGTDDKFPWFIVRIIQFERNCHLVTLPMSGEGVTEEKVMSLMKPGRGTKLCTNVHIKMLSEESPDSLRVAVDHVLSSAAKLGMGQTICTIKYKLRGIHTTGGINSRLFHHLNLSRQLSSTDPRDKFFAFYGVLQDDLEADALLSPDYTKSVVNVFVDVALYFIQRELCLDYFELLYDRPPGDSTIAGLPSWANDWTQTAGLNKFHTSTFSAGGDSYLGTSGHALRVELSEDRRRLGLQVYNAGRIRFHVPPQDDYTYDYVYSATNCGKGEYHATLGLLDQAKEHGLVAEMLEYLQYADCLARVKWLESPSTFHFTEGYTSKMTPPSRDIKYPTGESFYEAFWRTMVCNINREGTVAEDWVARAFKAYHDDWGSFLNLSDGPNEELDHESICKRFKIMHYNFTRQRRFCVTDSGLMGWVPRRAEVGDRICVIPGARLPYVIRQSGDYWKMIGHAYIHGLMEKVVHDVDLSLTEKGKVILGQDASPIGIWLC
ncbi:hypothetical protein F4804DRAFT_322811 [Jackrogersella minutella]|nr:hypothetical protein F4804DRAFT_322811 [Jackrogersella minutella]